MRRFMIAALVLLMFSTTTPAVECWTMPNGVRACAYAPGEYEKLHPRNTKWLDAFYALQLADAATTVAAVSSGAQEANPLFSWAFDKGVAVGAVWMVAVKSTVCYLLYKLHRANPAAVDMALKALDAAFLAIVLHNIWVIMF